MKYNKYITKKRKILFWNILQTNIKRKHLSVLGTEIKTIDSSVVIKKSYAKNMLIFFKVTS